MKSWIFVCVKIKYSVCNRAQCEQNVFTGAICYVQVGYTQKKADYNNRPVSLLLTYGNYTRLVLIRAALPVRPRR